MAAGGIRQSIQPRVTLQIACFLDIAGIDIGQAREPILLGLDRVRDHAPHDFRARGVQPAHEQQFGPVGIRNPGKAAEVGIGHGAGDHVRPQAEDRQLGIDGGRIHRGHGARADRLVARITRRLGDFQRDAAHEGDEVDLVRLDRAERTFGFAQFPPEIGGEHPAQRLGDGVLVFVAGDFLRLRGLQPDDLFLRDAALLRVEMRQFHRVAVRLIEDDQRRRGVGIGRAGRMHRRRMPGLRRGHGHRQQATYQGENQQVRSAGEQFHISIFRPS